MTTDDAIRPETPADQAAIRDLHRDAFARDTQIPPLVQRLRALDAPISTISLVAEAAGGEILGHVMLSHGWLDAPDRLIDILILSPLGVRTSAQRQGIGTALLARAVSAAESTSAPILFLEGNPAFYAPRGWKPAIPQGIRAPSLRIPERALQMIRLPRYAPGMTGTLVYRELWWDLDCVGLRKSAP